MNGKQDNVSKEVIDLLKARGLICDENINAKHREQQRKKRQKAFHNTKLLMKQYRNMAWVIENFEENINCELENSFSTFDDVVDRLDISMSLGSGRLEDRLKSLEKTRRVLEKINAAMSVLRKKPNRGEILYETLRLTYIDKESLCLNDIIFRLSISTTTYYKYLQEGLSVLSIQLWSSPNSGNLDFWLDIMSLIEK